VLVTKEKLCLLKNVALKVSSKKPYKCKYCDDEITYEQIEAVIGEKEIKFLLAFQNEKRFYK
jgi:hypothetical protein